MGERHTLNPTARIAKNSLVQMIGGLANKVLAVLLVIYAARQLGTAGFGTYAFLLTLLNIFYLITDFGLGTLTTRDVAREPAEEGRYLGNVLFLRFALALIAAAGMIATAAVVQPAPAIVKLAALLALSLFFPGGVDTCSAIFYAHQRMELPAGVGVIATMLRVGISLGALAAGAGLTALLVIYTAAAAVQFVLLLILLGMHMSFRFSLTWTFWKYLLGQAFPLALANLFSVVYFRVDTIMLAALAGQEAVGLYNAAFRLLEFTLMVPAYYVGAIFPVVSASQAAHPQRFLLIYRRSFKYMLIAALPMAVGASMLSPSLVDVLYGREYAASVPVLAVLMWSLVFIAVNSFNAPYLIAMGRQRTVTLLTAFGMVLNIALNAWAIPRWGIMGAAWVTLAAEAVTILLYFAALARPLALKFRMLRHAVRPLAAVGVMALVLRFTLTWDLGFQVFAAACVYLAVLVFTGTFDVVDRELFARLRRPLTDRGGPLA